MRSLVPPFCYTVLAATTVIKLALMGDNMEESSDPDPARQTQRQPVAVEADCAEIAFSTLLYRFLFFDWLFADMSKSRNLFERHAAWQHNRKMRRYLPLYLQRWSVITVFDVGMGSVFENLVGSKALAACFFTGSCVTVTGLMVIAVLWIFLSLPDMP
jgi:hypothetical protein